MTQEQELLKRAASEIRILRHHNAKGEFIYATRLLPKKEWEKRKKRRKIQSQSRRINRQK